MSKGRNKKAVDHTITEQDLENNPELGAQGVKPGDVIKVPAKPEPAPTEPAPTEPAESDEASGIPEAPESETEAESDGSEKIIRVMNPRRGRVEKMTEKEFLERSKKEEKLRKIGDA